MTYPATAGVTIAGTGVWEVHRLLSLITVLGYKSSGGYQAITMGYGANNIPYLSATPGTPDGTKFLRDDGVWSNAITRIFPASNSPPQCRLTRRTARPMCSMWIRPTATSASGRRRQRKSSQYMAHLPCLLLGIQGLTLKCNFMKTAQLLDK